MISQTYAAINNRYLDFIQMRGLVSLVNDNRVDNTLKEVLVHVYLSSIVNNGPENIGETAWYPGTAGKKCVTVLKLLSKITNMKPIKGTLTLLKSIDTD